MKTTRTLKQLSTFFAVLFISVITLNAQNTNLGTGAGNAGVENTSLGGYAGDVITGQQNLFAGYYSGRRATSGSYNVLLGNLSGYYLTTGHRNVMVGRTSGYNSNGSDNILMGYYTGRYTTGTHNIMSGSYSGYYTTSGSGNVFLGNAAGYYNKTGSNNICVGRNAGYKTTGSGSVFIGSFAGQNETGANKLYIDNSSTSSPLIYGDFNSNIMVVGGKLGIGTKNVTHELTVKGTICSEEIIVKDVAADFVFEEGYDLKSLNDVKSFINENGHLPDIAPASETSKGIKVSEFNTLLLQKIEELTLYIIEQDERISELEASK